MFDRLQFQEGRHRIITAQRREITGEELVNIVAQPPNCVLLSSLLPSRLSLLIRQVTATVSQTVSQSAAVCAETCARCRERSFTACQGTFALLSSSSVLSLQSAADDLQRRRRQRQSRRALKPLRELQLCSEGALPSSLTPPLLSCSLLWTRRRQTHIATFIYPV